jgi:hypothetical protein
MGEGGEDREYICGDVFLSGMDIFGGQRDGCRRPQQQRLLLCLFQF